MLPPYSTIRTILIYFHPTLCLLHKLNHDLFSAATVDTWSLCCLIHSLISQALPRMTFSLLSQWTLPLFSIFLFVCVCVCMRVCVCVTLSSLWFCVPWLTSWKTILQITKRHFQKKHNNNETSCYTVYNVDLNYVVWGILKIGSVWSLSCCNLQNRSIFTRKSKALIA